MGLEIDFKVRVGIVVVEIIFIGERQANASAALDDLLALLASDLERVNLGNFVIVIVLSERGNHIAWWRILGSFWLLLLCHVVGTSSQLCTWDSHLSDLRCGLLDEPIR